MPATIEAPAKTPSLGEAFGATLDSVAVVESTPEPEPVKEEIRTPEPENPKHDVKPPEPEPAKKPVADGELLNPNLAPKEDAKTKQPADEAPPKGMTKEAQQAFAEKRKALAAAEKTIETLNAERAEFEKKLNEAASTAPEITRLKAELEEAKKTIAAHEDEISIARVESTKQFKEAVAIPMQEVNEVSERLAKLYDLKPSAIIDAIKEADPAKRAEAIDEVTEGFRGMERDDVIRAARVYATAQKVAEEMRTNAKQRLDEITSRSKLDEESAMTAAAEEFKTGASQEWKNLQAQYPYLRPVDGAQTWNDHLARIEREAQALDVNNVSATDVAKLKVQAAALPEIARVAKHFQQRETELLAELEKAQERIKEYVGTEPGAGAGRGGDGSTPKPNTAGLSMGEKMALELR